MENKRPFSLYDFLGYFAPGALSLYIIMIFLYYLEPCYFYSIVNTNFGKLELFVGFVIIAYILGHSLNYLSSITIEKYSVWMYGFPSSFLLFGTKRNYLKKKSVNDNPHILNIQGCVLSDSFKMNFDLRNGKKNSKQRFFSWVASSFWRIFLYVFILPISLLDLLIGRGLKLKLFYTNQLDIVLSNAILKKLKALFIKLNINLIIGTDFYRVVSHYYYEKFKVHKSNYDNYVALYGFARTLSFIFCLTTWFFVYYILFNKEIIIENKYIFFCFLISISYIFYMAFMKFYRRYTLEGYMCLLVDTEIK